MSRGPGLWQRVLLDALTSHDVVPVGTVVHNDLGRPGTRAELVAARRAAGRLAEDGKARAIYLGCCRRCGELSETWDCPACRSGCGQVLVLTPTEGVGATIRGVQSTACHRPRWISVTSAPNAPEATLSGVPSADT